MFCVMVIWIFWFGVSVWQVQEQVIDWIGCKLQEMLVIDFLCSYLCFGELLIFFMMKDLVFVKDVFDIWYQICKKVGDIGYMLLFGVQGLFFNDEFGDVYINIWMFEGDGFMFV